MTKLRDQREIRILARAHAEPPLPYTAVNLIRARRASVSLPHNARAPSADAHTTHTLRPPPMAGAAYRTYIHHAPPPGGGVHAATLASRQPASRTISLPRVARSAHHALALYFSFLVNSWNRSRPGVGLLTAAALARGRASHVRAGVRPRGGVPRASVSPTSGVRYV